MPYAGVEALNVPQTVERDLRKHRQNLSAYSEENYNKAITKLRYLHPPNTDLYSAQELEAVLSRRKQFYPYPQELQLELEAPECFR